MPPLDTEYLLTICAPTVEALNNVLSRLPPLWRRWAHTLIPRHLWGQTCRIRPEGFPLGTFLSSGRTETLQAPMAKGGEGGPFPNGAGKRVGEGLLSASELNYGAL